MLDDEDAARARWPPSPTGSTPAPGSSILGQKLVQLAMPGVPDVYQGCELVDLSLVDPDNRRRVDFDERRAAAGRAWTPASKPADLDDEKLLVTSRALRLRREHPEWFVGAGSAYVPLPTSTGQRGRVRPRRRRADVRAVARGHPAAASRSTGTAAGASTRSRCRRAPWRDVLTGREVAGGTVQLADLLADLPVAFLLRA